MKKNSAWVSALAFTLGAGSALLVAAASSELALPERIDRYPSVITYAEHHVYVPRVIEREVEVPIEVQVPDPSAYQRGFTDAQLAADEPGGAIDPSSLAEALSTPCVMEDSDNCFWRGDVFGNLTGGSFVSVEGHVFPLDSALEAGR